MSSPFTRSMTEDEELMYDAGLMDGAAKKQAQIIKQLEELFDKAENAETRRFLTMGIAFIKGQKDNETVVFLTQAEAEQLAKAIGEAE